MLIFNLYFYLFLENRRGFGLSIKYATIPCAMDTAPHRKNHKLTESDDNNQILQYVQRPKTIEDLLSMLNNEKECKVHPDAEKILIGQTASDIASHSITNLADACEKLINQNNLSVKNQKFSASFFNN